MGLFTGLLVEAAAGTALKVAGAAYMGIKEKVGDGPQQKAMDKLMEGCSDNYLIHSGLCNTFAFLKKDGTPVFSLDIDRKTDSKSVTRIINPNGERVGLMYIKLHLLKDEVQVLYKDFKINYNELGHKRTNSFSYVSIPKYGLELRTLNSLKPQKDILLNGEKISEIRDNFRGDVVIPYKDETVMDSIIFAYLVYLAQKEREILKSRAGAGGN